MTLKEHAKQQETQIREILEQLSIGMVELDSVHDDGRNTSFYIDYNEGDMLNAATILYHVCSNYAIKHGIITAENVTEKVNVFRDMLKETFGLDTVYEVEKMRIMNDLEKFGGKA